jgi:hypothetical protein
MMKLDNNSIFDLYVDQAKTLHEVVLSFLFIFDQVRGFMSPGV